MAYKGNINGHCRKIIPDVLDCEEFGYVIRTTSRTGRRLVPNGNPIVSAYVALVDIRRHHTSITLREARRGLHDEPLKLE